MQGRIDRARGRMLADVAGAFTGFTLSFRLPDGMSPGAVTINGHGVDAVTRLIDGVWYVYPVLNETGPSQVMVTYQSAAGDEPVQQADGG